MIRLEACIGETGVSIEVDELIGGEEVQPYLVAWTATVERLLVRTPKAEVRALHDHQVPEPEGVTVVRCRCARCTQHDEKQTEWLQPGGHIISEDQLS